MSKANKGGSRRTACVLNTLFERLSASPLWGRAETVEDRIALAHLWREHVMHGWTRQVWHYQVSRQKGGQ